MKKILLGTTAVIALATISTQAFAAEDIKLSLGGFMNQYVGLANNDDATPTPTMKMGQRSSTEIYFRGSTVLDNGLSVAVDVQREGDKGNQGNDISALTVSSDAMGALTLGGTTHVSDDFAVGAPTAGALGLVDASGDGWAQSTTGNSGLENTYGVSQTGGKELKIKYVTPSFSGFTAGVSYDAAANVNGQKAGAARAGTDDASSIAMMYEGEVSGASVSADVSRTHFNQDTTTAGDFALSASTGLIAAGANDGNDFTADHFGLNVGMAGFTVGGSYNDFNNQRQYGDGKGWDLGVGYETGPYSVAVTYMKSEVESGAVALADTKDTEWLVGAGYDLGAGVGLVASYYNTKSTQPATASSTASGIVAGIEVGF